MKVEASLISFVLLLSIAIRRLEAHELVGISGLLILELCRILVKLGLTRRVEVI